MFYPNRNCTQGNRLHRKASLLHSQDQPASSASNMARFGLFDQVDSSPHPTPVIEESEFNINSIRSTPCPGRGIFPLGPDDDSSLTANDDNSSQVRASTNLIPDSAPAPAVQNPRLHRARDQQTHRLRASLTTLREALTNSTALVNNLRTRNDFFRAENLAKQAQLKEVQKVRDSARSVTQGEDARWRVIALIVSLVVVGVMGYAYWCWWNGPEMQYVLRRRREVLGL